MTTVLVVIGATIAARLARSAPSSSLRAPAAWRADDRGRRSSTTRPTTRRSTPTGGVRSVQGADIDMPAASSSTTLWTAAHARAPRAHLLALPVAAARSGLIRVATPSDERYVVPAVRARSAADASRRPSTRWTSTRGIVRWRIEKGVLVVARRAAAATATWRSTSQRCDCPSRDSERVHVEVEVANFYPRSPRGSAAASTPTRSRASTSSSPTASCARWRKPRASRVDASARFARAVDDVPRPRRPPDARPTRSRSDVHQLSRRPRERRC